MEIDGATAFITGGSGGLGTVIATALAMAGANIAIGYRSGLARAQETKVKVEALDRKAALICLDHTDAGSVENAIGEVAKEFGGIDLLVNNAGMASGGHALPVGDLAAFTPEIWDELMAVNVRGPYLMARAAAPWLRLSKWGRIVNLGSTIDYGTWGAGA